MIRRPELDVSATVPALLHRAVDRWPDGEMVVTEDERMTFIDAERASRQLAKRLLAAGCGKGTRIATQFPYGVEWLLWWLAVDRIGALHMPFSTAYKPAELRKALRHGDVHLFVSPSSMFGESRVAFVEEAVPELAEAHDADLRVVGLPYLRTIWFDGTTTAPRWASAMPYQDSTDSDISDELFEELEAEVASGDLAITIFTSGTTSEPKAVNHSHGALVRKGAHLAVLMGWDEHDRVFCGMPFFWVGGIAMTVVPALYAGSTLLCLDRTQPLRSLDLMERECATQMTGWPGVRGPIEAHPTRAARDIPALEIPPTGFGVQGSLGMTESLASYSFPDWSLEVPEGRTGCMGPVIESGEVRIADPETLEPLADGEEGAILIRGYYVMQGIYKKEREEVFTPDGFYNTGDKGYMLGPLLFLSGRLTEMVKTSGNNVAPPEVEAVFREFTEVKDIHVLGVPDADRGEVVAALLVPQPGVEVDVDEIRERARRQLSNYKVPRYVVVVEADEVPWLATGKPDRLAIKGMLARAKP